jgi:general secretion pathway protein F
MAAFEYKALDAKGRSKKGVIEADSARQARQLLRNQDLFPTAINTTRDQTRSGVGSRHELFTRNLGGLDRVLFTRQLATLIGSSMPIEEALAAVAEQSEKQYVRALVMAIRSKVLEGFTLAGSLGEYPGSFNSLYRSTVSAGEQSGYLDNVLENLADYQERQFSATRNVEMALFYPVALLSLAFLIVGALMIYVVPEMVSVIVDTGQQLPWFTLVLIQITEVLSSYWWLIIIAFVSLVLATNWLLRQPNIRLQWDRLKFDIPLVGRVSRSANSSRFANTLSILTRSGVPLVDAMLIASDVVANSWLQRALKRATQSVSEGRSLKASLTEVGQFPPMMLHMIAAGEQSGQLDNMLGRVAEFQQNEVERIVATVVKLFEPLMLLIMGGVVLFIVMAILLPLLSMNQLV